MFLSKIFWVQVILFAISLYGMSYLFDIGWLNTTLLIIFIISDIIITINLIDEFKDIKPHSMGSLIGSSIGSFVEGWNGNISGQGFFSEAGESLGKYFDEEGMDYHEVRARIYIESFVTLVLMIVIYYFIG